ncbi:MAG: RtcB family protein [Candidatus Hodarchaeales archaeon]
MNKNISRFNLDILKEGGLKKLVLLPDFCPGKSFLPIGTVSIFDKEIHTPLPSYIGRDIGCGMSLFSTDLYSQDLDLQQLVDEIDMNIAKTSDIEFTLGSHFIDLCRDHDDNLQFVIHAGFKQYGMQIVKKGYKDEKYISKASKNVALASSNRKKMAKAVYETLNLDPIPPLLDKPHNTVQITDQGYLYRKGAVELSPGELSILPSNLLHPIFIIKAKDQINVLENSFSHGTVRKASRSKPDRLSLDYSRLRKQIKMPRNLTDKSLHELLPTEYESFHSYYDQFNQYLSIEKEFEIIGYLGYKHNY